MAKKARSIKVFRDGPSWVVQKVGSSRASAVRNTKKEAYQVAREIALNQGLSILLYDRDGNFVRKVWPQEEIDEGCFLTTACVKYYGLCDSAYELETLRKFRDTYLLKSENRKKLVSHYYKVAPIIVDHLERSSDKAELYKGIFDKIRVACCEIESNQFRKATKTYISAVLILLNYFKIDYKWE